MQRTMLELLNQLDGFEPTQNIKVHRLVVVVVVVVVEYDDNINIIPDPALRRPGHIE